MPDKQEEIIKRLKDGSLNHQTKEPVNQNILLSFNNISAETNEKKDGDDDAWVVDEDAEKCWDIANDVEKEQGEEK